MVGGAPTTPLAFTTTCTITTTTTAACLQEVEYVKEEAKLVYLLECLQKTAPPVLIFAGGLLGPGR